MPEPDARCQMPDRNVTAYRMLNAADINSVNRDKARIATKRESRQSANGIPSVDIDQKNGLMLIIVDWQNLRAKS